MPSFTEILAAITGFIADYAVFFAAGTVVALMVGAAKRLAKGGR
jgi:hypothetical protein